MKHFWKIMLLGVVLMFTISCSTQQAGSQKDEPPSLTLEQQAQALADVLVSDHGTTSVQYALIDRGTIRPFRQQRRI
jgi:hypothetical protein